MVRPEASRIVKINSSVMAKMTHFFSKKKEEIEIKTKNVRAKVVLHLYICVIIFIYMLNS